MYALAMRGHIHRLHGVRYIVRGRRPTIKRAHVHLAAAVVCLGLAAVSASLFFRPIRTAIGLPSAAKNDSADSGTATLTQKAGNRPASSPSAMSAYAGSSPLPSKNGFGLALGDTLPGLTQAQLNSEMDGIAQLGVSWIRIDMAWPDVQPNDAAHYDWSGLDRVVAAANKRDIKILAILDYTPAWARQSACTGGEKCAPANDGQFAAYAAAAVKRYAPQHIQAWEVWNEPNLEGSWQPAPSAAAYTGLLEASYKAIRQADKGAMVITGGLGPLDNQAGSIDQLSFLRGLYASGAKPYFDAVGYHPYSFPALPSYTISWNSWSTMSALPDSVRSIMTANGDSGKQIWITEYGAPTGGPGALATSNDSNFDAGPDHVDEALQAEMVNEATSQYKATPWLGGFFWYSYQDLGTSSGTNENFFGLIRHDGTHKPAYAAYHQAIITK